MPNYDVTIIGGGSAGLVLAVASANLGKKTALVEKHKLGGDCLWTGCVPSKAMIKSAKIAHYIKEASKYGIETNDFKVNFDAVMEHVRRAQRVIEEEHDNPERFRQLGVDIYFGSGKFVSKSEFVLSPNNTEQNSADTQTILSDKFVISTGSRPVAPPILGLDNINYLNSENVWHLSELPPSLAVIGGGPIGIELGQTFHRLGSSVTILDRGERILKKEEPAISERIYQYLTEEGIEIILNADIAEVIPTHSQNTTLKGRSHPSLGEFNIKAKVHDEEVELSCQQILVAAGRKANVEGLGLNEIGVKTGQRGIEVNKRLQTSVKNMYAAGDVIAHYLFTHVAAFQAKKIVRNLFFPFSSKIDYSVVPWTTFCDPEIAHCGLTEAEAREQHKEVDVFRVDFHDVDRAVAEDETKGFIKIVATKWRGNILGTHIIGPNAGELIHEFVLAMQHGIPLRKLSSLIHVYPTLSGIAGRVATKWLSEGSLIRKLRGLFGKKEASNDG